MPKRYSKNNGRYFRYFYDSLNRWVLTTNTNAKPQTEVNLSDLSFANFNETGAWYAVAEEMDKQHPHLRWVFGFRLSKSTFFNIKKSERTHDNQNQFTDWQKCRRETLTKWLKLAIPCANEIAEFLKNNPEVIHGLTRISTFSEHRDDVFFRFLTLAQTAFNDEQKMILLEQMLSYGDSQAWDASLPADPFTRLLKNVTVEHPQFTLPRKPGLKQYLILVALSIEDDKIQRLGDRSLLKKFYQFLKQTYQEHAPAGCPIQEFFYSHSIVMNDLISPPERVSIDFSLSQDERFTQAYVNHCKDWEKQFLDFTNQLKNELLVSTTTITTTATTASTVSDEPHAEISANLASLAKKARERGNLTDESAAFLHKRLDELDQEFIKLIFLSGKTENEDDPDARLQMAPAPPVCSNTGVATATVKTFLWTETTPPGRSRTKRTRGADDLEHSEEQRALKRTPAAPQ